MLVYERTVRKRSSSVDAMSKYLLRHQPSETAAPAADVQLQDLRRDFDPEVLRSVDSAGSESIQDIVSKQIAPKVIRSGFATCDSSLYAPPPPPPPPCRRFGQAFQERRTLLASVGIGNSSKSCEDLLSYYEIDGGESRGRRGAQLVASRKDSSR